MIELCYICGGDNEVYLCETCEEYVCIDCAKGYDQWDQITETMCMMCYNGHEQYKISVYEEGERYKKELEEKKKRRSEKARARYRLPESVEKRRLKKEQQKKERRESYEKRMKTVADIINNWR